jgi:CRP-like cAMP-binding protein
MPVHSSLIQQFALLKVLPEALLQELALASALRTFAKRELVLHRDAPSAFFCLLLEGRVQATDFTLDGKEVCLYFIEEGQFFGEVSMLDALSQDEIVMANRKSQVLMVPNEVFRPILWRHPGLAESVVMNLTRRVRAQSRQRQILSITNPLQRVCSQILLLLQLAGAKTEGAAPQDVLPDPPTHQELAMMANLSRETVTRVFQILQSQSLVLREKDALVVSQPELLHQVATGLLDLNK